MGNSDTSPDARGHMDAEGLAPASVDSAQNSSAEMEWRAKMSSLKGGLQHIQEQDERDHSSDDELYTPPQYGYEDATVPLPYESTTGKSSSIHVYEDQQTAT